MADEELKEFKDGLCEGLLAVIEAAERATGEKYLGLDELDTMQYEIVLDTNYRYSVRIPVKPFEMESLMGIEGLVTSLAFQNYNLVLENESVKVRYTSDKRDVIEVTTGDESISQDRLEIVCPAVNSVANAVYLKLEELSRVRHLDIPEGKI